MIDLRRRIAATICGPFCSIKYNTITRDQHNMSDDLRAIGVADGEEGINVGNCSIPSDGH